MHTIVLPKIVTRMQEGDRPRRTVVRARVGASAAFFTNGALLGSLLPRYPQIAEVFGLGTAQFGLVVISFALGAVCAAHTAGSWLRRFGSRTVVSIGTCVMAAGFAAAGSATVMGPGSLWLFAVCLFVAGAADAVVDVAQNAQGLRIQGVYGRPVLSFLHAGWSAGAAVGGVLGTVAAHGAVPIPVHLTLSGAVGAVLVVRASTRFLPDDDHAHRTAAEPVPVAVASNGRNPSRIVVAAFVPLAVIALCGHAVEEVGTNWAAYFLHTEYGVPVGLAGTGAVAVLTAQFIGRLIGDKVLGALGPRTAIQISLAAIVSGMTVAAWAPTSAPLFALYGFALAGLGCAITVPVAFAQADTIPNLRPHQGIAVIGWLLRAITLVLSPTIGFVGDLAGLRLALTLVLVVAAIGMALTPLIRDPRS